jgi:hypothetical protein
MHVTMPGSLARQPCPAALLSNLARQPCSAALLGSLAQQFDKFRPDLMRVLARSAVTTLYYSTDTGNIFFLRILYHIYILASN